MHPLDGPEGHIVVPADDYAAVEPQVASPRKWIAHHRHQSVTMARVIHRTTDELVAALDTVRASPPDQGVVELIVRRPAVDQREVLDQADLTEDAGIIGDTWRGRGSKHTPDGSAEANRQITIMNARAIALFAGDDRTRWAEAGDQLFIDLDLSDANLPTGSRLQLGTAVVEITVEPHNGCAKFADRFGVEAARFVNSPEGKELHLRGVNARVVQAGTVAAGDRVTKVAARRLTPSS
jgi:MOSC domain-containing protein YiiM